MTDNTRTALRAAKRAAKADLTEAALAYHAAIDAHLRALRGESRTCPVYVEQDSDKAIDALRRAEERYTWCARNVELLATTERRAKYNTATA